MEYCRVYVLDAQGHINDPPEVIECLDDRRRSNRAANFLDGRVIEVWNRSRRVISLARPARVALLSENPKKNLNEFKPDCFALIDPYMIILRSQVEYL